MKPIMHLWPQAPLEQDGQITLKTTIEMAGKDPTVLWYRLPAEYGNGLSPNSDPLVVATVLWAMAQASQLVVHGEVSPSLLNNLELFQEAWSTWRPGKFQMIPIVADREQPWVRSADQRLAISTFSGGVDSCYTVLRHQPSHGAGFPGRQRQHLRAGVLVHGFDIPLDQPAAFEKAWQRGRKILESVEMVLIPITTNFREVVTGVSWEDGHGVAIAACLLLLQNQFSVGLIASGRSYRQLKFPWGSNPLSDRWLSNHQFEVVHDGATQNRTGKIKALLDWPAALDNLRVCWEGAAKDSNCCQCEKCIRNILTFRVLGAGLPACFEQDVSDQQIRTLRLRPTAVEPMQFVLQAAKVQGIQASWVSALEGCIQRNEWLNRVDTALPKGMKQRLLAVKQSLNQGK